ncbi:hypothetical protein T440DRAFT_512484 [Plenodomus tracheiphilus IPT5]|uniref:Uncharacterized protein n=1 Tax=Plenodomus tracheiphilus IPT5 TaxID=1408161 RepID=A0A6A7BQ67_9PLEO|nr:hypothetical protein T440DRAFT_512484 [Plenodomus tracheiphilus IPT5]
MCISGNLSLDAEALEKVKREPGLVDVEIEPEAEMDEQEQEDAAQSSYTSLSGSDDTSDTANGSSTHTRSRDLLRPFRLQFLASISGRCVGRSSKREHRKVAIYQDRALAAGHSLLHLIPLGGAVTLLVFQWTNYWVSFDNDNSTSLQFAAKLHELSMQASIVEVLLSVVRNRLIGDFVPLGALSAAIHATQVSYLWSLDFFSISKSQALSAWRRILFMMAIFALLGLTSLVGPSSAVLMIPRPGSPRTVPDRTETRYWNGSVDTLYPSRIGESEGFNLDLISLNKSLQYSLPYEGVDTHDSGIKTTHRSVVYKDNKSFYYRLLRHASRDKLSGSATIPAQVIANSFGPVSVEGPWWNATISVVAAHPVVDVQCTDTQTYDGNPLQYKKDDLTSLDTLAHLETAFGEGSGSVEVRKRYPYSEEVQVWFPPIWAPSPESGSQSSIVVLITGKVSGMQIDSSNESSSMLPWILAKADASMRNGSYASVSAQVCTVSTYWNTGQVHLVWNKESARVQSDRSATKKQADFKPMTLDFTGPWANMTRSAIYNQFMMDRDTADLLSITLAVTLSAIPGASSIGNASLSDISTLSSNSNTTDFTAFEFVTTEYGFGYGTRTTSVYLSITVILTYCVITISYIVYTLVTGVCSTAWNSGIDNRDQFDEDIQ